MKNWSLVCLVVVATAFLGLGARPASALICCSACDAKPDSPACQHGCSPSCAVDDEPTASDLVIYDDAAQVCYAAPAGDAGSDAPALASN
jgi:hypothetical protein